MSGDSSTSIVFPRRAKRVSRKMWQRIKVLELNFTANVVFGHQKEFLYLNLKDKNRIFWCCMRAFTLDSLGFVGDQTVMFNENRPF